MLATHASIGEGVDLPMTTQEGRVPVRLICLDLPLTHASQMQLEGRHRRLLAQPFVREWNIHYVRAMAPGKDGPELMTIDGALVRILKMKEARSNEFLMSEEDCGFESDSNFTTPDANMGTLQIIDSVCANFSDNSLKRQVELS